MGYIIDPPTLFSPLEDWVKYRKSLNDTDCEDVDNLKVKADNHIAKLKENL